MTPDEVSKAISRYGTVGQVRDVVPKRFGVSGRVIDERRPLSDLKDVFGMLENGSCLKCAVIP